MFKYSKYPSAPVKEYLLVKERNSADGYWAEQIKHLGLQVLDSPSHQ
jgi:hypothetical protein